MTSAMVEDEEALTVRVPAKVNLHLGVGPVRADGFHPLVTVYQAIGIYDDVSVRPAGSWSVTTSALGEAASAGLRGVPDDDANLAVRAGRALAAHHRLPPGQAAHIEVAKAIPVAGGLAGGSADAAGALVALDRLWDLRTTDDDLLALAASLGSDVPFALVGGTALGTGRGELVERVPDVGDWWWVVVPAAGGLSTPGVYAEHDRLARPGQPTADTLEHPDALLAALRTGSVEGLAEALRNDLEEAAVSLRPDLRGTLAAGREAGALATLVSGSGPTCLCLCGGHEQALAVQEHLQQAGHPGLSAAPGPVAGAHLVEYA